MKSIRINLVAILLLFIGNITSWAQSKDLLIRASASKQALAKILVTDKSWINIPAYNNREAWNKASTKYRAEIISRGEKLLPFVFKSTPAMYYEETKRKGNRTLADNFNSDKYTTLKNLMMAELVEGKWRFMEKIADAVFAICEMTSWSGTAHLTAQKAGLGVPDEEEPIVDLSVAEIANMMSWCYHYFKTDLDKINPLIARRIEYTLKRNVIKPYLSRDYSWMGLNGQKTNNWNIWINYNMLNVFLLMEKDSTKKLDGIYRSLLGANNFINSIEEDGACEEGPGYWNHAGGKMYEYLDLIGRVTNNNINIFNEPKVRNIGAYIYKACIYYPYFINFSDAGPTQSPSPYVVYHFGERTKDPVMEQFGLMLVKERGWFDRIWGGVFGIEKLVSNLFDYEALKDKASTTASQPFISAFWLPQTQIATARDDDGSGFYFAAKGGYNAAPHGHNDAGSFILFYNKKPVFVDAGVGAYTIKTFSKERYTIWSMQSGYHNLVTINGKDQKEGKEFVASNCLFADTKNATTFSVDIAKAYEPNALVKSWVRTYAINKSKNFTITDSYEVTSNNGQSYINLLTPAVIDNGTKGKIIINAEGGIVNLSYNPNELEASVEEVKMDDASMEKTWSKGLRRIRLHLISTSLKGNTNIVVSAANK